ncbi:MAG: molybdate ABC transporter permease subunit [Sumerlaeia bacterium]
MDWRPLFVSLQVGLVSTAIALLLGAALGAWLAHRSTRWTGALVLLPLVLPPTVLGYYLLVLIGRRGPVGQLYEALTGQPLVFTLKAAVIAACAATIPIVARQLAAAFAEIPHEVKEAARIDGAGGLSMFLWIQLPLIRGPIAAAAAIAFARAVGDFGTTLMVAGNIPGRTQTASIAIYDLINAGKDDQAVVLVVAISVVALAVLALAGGRAEGTRTKSA